MAKQQYAVIYKSEFDALSHIKSHTTFRVFAELKMKIRGRPVADYLNNQDLKRIGMDRHTYGRAIKELMALNLIRISEWKMIRGHECRLFAMVHDAYTTCDTTHHVEPDLCHQTPPPVTLRTPSLLRPVTLDTTTCDTTHIPLTTENYKKETIRTTSFDEILKEDFMKDDPVKNHRYSVIKNAIKEGYVDKNLMTYDDFKNIINIEADFNEMVNIIEENRARVMAGKNPSTLLQDPVRTLSAQVLAPVDALDFFNGSQEGNHEALTIQHDSTVALRDNVALRLSNEVSPVGKRFNDWRINKLQELQQSSTR